MNNAIEIRNISKAFGKIQALDDVSLNVRRGELFGLIGPDGAGKSTLYRILTTLAIPDAGSASMVGYDCVKDYAELRKHIGYMPERFSLYQDLSVRENLNFFADLFKVKVKDNFDLVAPIYNPQLSKFPRRRAGDLSGGMKQKLALSCALIHRPEVLLLDEPTTGVDAVSRSEFWEMLRGLRAKGITIIVSTSYMDEAQMCDRIALINKGKILKVDTPSDLIAHNDENLYNAVATNMFGLLNALRSTPGVENCYTFGATLHVVAAPDFDPAVAEASLRDQGLHDVRIYPAHGDIEDLFIKLM